MKTLRCAGYRRSIIVDLDDGLGKLLRGFLREVVPNAARDDPVLIFAREFPGIGTGLRVRGTIGIAFEGNGGHTDERAFGEVTPRPVEREAPPGIELAHDGLELEF